MKNNTWFLLIALVLISGWNWETHPAFVESIYYSLNDTDQAHFNLTALQEGSIAPDRDFHDNRNHHYPPSYNLTVYWLRKAKDSYAQEDFTAASYAFGVASHYVSDSFAAPHNVQKESSRDHSLYEKQGSAGYLVVPCSQPYEHLDLNKTLLEATSTGKTWQSWLATKDVSYPQEAVAAAMEPLSHLFWQTFHISCLRKETRYVSASWLPSSSFTLLFLAVTLYFLLATVFSLLRQI
ncbi:zinc dependent phospholipase C family protein [Candidatus Woesearchaeota archaeon]|nr:zinc dependent phospholipase C family protein [Candidatus Woesearchaeota archaeon]